MEGKILICLHKADSTCKSRPEGEEGYSERIGWLLQLLGMGKMVGPYFSGVTILKRGLGSKSH